MIDTREKVKPIPLSEAHKDLQILTTKFIKSSVKKINKKFLKPVRRHIDDFEIDKTCRNASNPWDIQRKEDLHQNQKAKYNMYKVADSLDNLEPILCGVCN